MLVPSLKTLGAGISDSYQTEIWETKLGFYSLGKDQRQYICITTN